MFHSVGCVIDNREEIIQLDGNPTLDNDHPHDKVSRNSVCYAFASETDV